MATTMTSRMKLSFSLQKNRGFQDERISRSQSQPRSIQDQPEESVPSADEEDQQRQASIRAANDFIYDLVILEDRWSSHMSLIRISCPYTLSELHALGNLPQADGIAACRKLIRVPVIHEEIGQFIWTQLATVVRGPNFAEDSLSEADKSTTTQPNEELFLAHLDDRFRFDKPASASTWGRVRDSPPMSPKDVQQRGGYFCRHEDIDEGDEGLEDRKSEAPATTRGMVVNRPGKSLSSARPDAERQRSFFSNGVRNGSHIPLLKWSRERGSSTAASRTSSTSRDRSESIAGRLGSAVGGFGQRVAGALGDGMSQSQPRNRSLSARSL